EGILIPRPKTPSDRIPYLHLKGCRIGSDETLPFLTLLKEALGGELEITAPKHSHKIMKGGVLNGFLEYMAYEFTIRREVPVKDRIKLIREFNAQTRLKPNRFKLINSQPVPSNKWEEWLSRDRVKNPARSVQWKTSASALVRDKEGTNTLKAIS